MTPVIAVCDACVLYPATLRSFLVYLALEGVFLPRWTDQIHDEWMRNVLANRPDIRPAQLRRTRDLMALHLPDASVVGHEPLIPTLGLPDPDDRHVLAAAITAGATVIVTANVTDFPPSALAPFGIVARRPDAFVVSLFGVTPDATCRAFANQRPDLRRPARSVDELLANFERCGLVSTAALLRPCASIL